jgi:vacuolar-type H+-ATPase subunit H
MDEPGDVTGGFDDDSLASEVGDRVKEIVDGAERHAIAAYEDAEDAAERLLERARAQARMVREEAEREARGLAAERVRRMRELRQAIGSRAEELASFAEDAGAVMSGIDLFLEALAERADLIARETGVEAVEQAHEEPPPAPEPEANGTAPVAPEPEPEPALAAMGPAEIPEPLRDVRLGALRMAVAGASRNELESELRETLDARDAAAILDDVFGRPRSPFPKWAAAAKRAR